MCRKPPFWAKSSTSATAGPGRGKVALKVPIVGACASSSPGPLAGPYLQDFLDETHQRLMGQCLERWA
jgi:hypothetical protein